MNPQELYEAYMSVYEDDDRREMRRLASKERQAEKKAESEFRTKGAVGSKKSGPKLSTTKMSKKEGESFAKQTMKDAEHIAKKAKGHTVGNPFPEEYDLFDVVLEFLQAEGYAETLEEAEWLMANMNEGIDMKTFKANRQKAQRSAASADAKKRGHVDKFTGKTYGTAEASSRRKNIHTPEKKPSRDAARDAAGGETGHGGALRAKKVRKARAMGELGEGLDLFDEVLSEITAAGYSVEQALAYMVYEAQYARNNPEKYEREQRKSQSARERRMNDPKTGINSKAFNDFYNAQMGRKKKVSEATYGAGDTSTSADKRMVVTNADKKGNTPAYQRLMQGNPAYVAAPHLKGV